MSDADALLSAADAQLVIDPAAYGDARAIGALFERLRATNPVARVELPGYEPFWLLTKHADVRQVALDNEKFFSGLCASFLTDKAGQDYIRQVSGGRSNLVRSVVSMDLPEHAKYRGVAQSWFMPRNIRSLSDRIRLLAQDHIKEMLASGGEIDFASDVASRFPLRVILETMDIPQSQESHVLRLTRELLGTQDPDTARGGRAGRMANGMADVFGDFREFFARVAEERRSGPGSDIATIIAQSKIDGAPMPVDDAVDYFVTLATAGHDTTSSSLSGAVFGLLEFPQEFERVKRGEVSVKTLVDEAIRWTSPIYHRMRKAVVDVKLRGQVIRAGDLVMINLLSANRDEEVFSEPNGFKADRSPNPHIGFGYGPHVCIGQHLAKLELEIFLEEFVRSIEFAEAAGPARWLDTTLIGGLKSLPIRVRGAGPLSQ